MNAPSSDVRLERTRAAFDSVAADYDGARTSGLLRDMRTDVWRFLEAQLPPAGRLLDIGCGPGEDAVHFASLGHHVTAVDLSPRMIGRTRSRAEVRGLQTRVDTHCLGAHELHRLDGDACYDGAYSNLGPLNCVPDLASVATQCARLLKPDAPLVLVMMGRWCPWEMAYYGLRGRWARVSVRLRRGGADVPLNGHRVWTAYCTPRECLRAFAHEFEFVQARGLALFAPPPYLGRLASRWPRTYRALRRLDGIAAGWPVLRQFGDHFILQLRRRSDQR